MQDVLTAETVKNLTKPILEKGFFFEYFYQKGGDSSCVYICRFKKGKEYWDWREVSGGEEINIVTFVNGEFGFPSLKTLYPKEYKKFQWKHLFRRPTMDERRAFVASLLVAELQSGKPDFFGIEL
ncbi:MAG: hypothetical protein IKZ28_06205 [Clostridia bacterium]|nr:hypothetical protein [Clostridia bacterium]